MKVAAEEARCTDFFVTKKFQSLFREAMQLEFWEH